jgi:Tfp pilus assembly protein PilF
MDPDDAQANRFFGTYLKDIGQTAKAKAYLERALELDPKDRTVRTLLANLK